MSSSGGQTTGCHDPEPPRHLPEAYSEPPVPARARYARPAANPCRDRRTRVRAKPRRRDASWLRAHTRSSRSGGGTGALRHITHPSVKSLQTRDTSHESNNSGDRSCHFCEFGSCDQRLRCADRAACLLLGWLTAAYRTRTSTTGDYDDAASRENAMCAGTPRRRSQQYLRLIVAVWQSVRSTELQRHQPSRTDRPQPRPLGDGRVSGDIRLKSGSCRAEIGVVLSAQGRWTSG